MSSATATSTPAPIVGGQRRPTYSSEEQRGLRFRLGAIWRYRDLIREITARNLKVRYRRSIFGFLWTLLNPLLNALVFALVFQVLLRSDVDRYILFIIVGITTWNAFAQSVLESMNMITGSDNLIKRVNFPHEVLVISTVFTNMINFLFALPTVFVIMALTHTPTHSQIIAFPIIYFSAICFALGISFISAATNVFFKDTRNFLDVVMMLWWFLTPIIYPMKHVFPTAARIVYIVNPMASIVESYRLLFYNNAWPAPDFLARTLVSCLITLAVGWIFFAKLSPRFVEEL